MFNQKVTRNSLKKELKMLTNREQDVLSLAARGMTNQNIGDELGISCRTVKCILYHACVKLRAQNRTQALFVALSRGHIGIGEILSADELVSLFSSLGPEVMDTITQRLKQQHSRLLSNTERLPYIKGKRLSTAVTANTLAECTSARQNQNQNLPFQTVA
jgi:DNA-binding CsgD family transcriptional regulator